IAATNRDLRTAISSGQFREDLYYRLSVFPILVPPLRQRAEDIPVLAEAFVRSFCNKTGRAQMELTPDSIRQLRAYHWPGNVRELQNVIVRAVILSHGQELSFDGILPIDTVPAVSEALVHDEASPRQSSPRTALELRELERENILRALEKSNWRVA